MPSILLTVLRVLSIVRGSVVMFVVLAMPSLRTASWLVPCLVRDRALVRFPVSRLIVVMWVFCFSSLSMILWLTLSLLLAMMKISPVTLTVPFSSLGVCEAVGGETIEDGGRVEG